MTASEKRRTQNRIAQRRWRERQRSSSRNLSSTIDASSNQRSKRPSKRANAQIALDEEAPEQLRPSRSASRNTQISSRSHGADEHSTAGARTGQTSIKASATGPNPGDLQANADDMIKALLSQEEQAKDDGQQINPQQLTASQLVSIAYTAAWPAHNVFLPGCHFATALVRNGRRFGLDSRFLSVSASISFIHRDWLSYQKSSHGAVRLAREGRNLRSNSLLDSSIHGRTKSHSPVEDCVISPATTTTSRHSTRTAPKGTASSQSEVLTPPTEFEDLSESEDSSVPSETVIKWETLPDNMFPTEAQLSVPHHPYIDVSFPWPSVRTKILMHLQHNMIDSRDLCDSVFLAGLQSNLDAEPAFIIWGEDAMDEAAWEVGESFAHRWWFLLDDDIIRRTNWWRRRRGLPQISNTPDTALLEPRTSPQHRNYSPSDSA